MFRSPSRSLKLEIQGGESLLNSSTSCATSSSVRSGARKRKAVRTRGCRSRRRCRSPRSRYLNIVVIIAFYCPLRSMVHQTFTISIDHALVEMASSAICTACSGREIVGFDRVSALVATTQHSLPHVRETLMSTSHMASTESSYALYRPMALRSKRRPLTLMIYQRGWTL